MQNKSSLYVTIQIPSLENIKIPRHSCMLLAGIYAQHGFPIKHFGNDDIFMRVCEQLRLYSYSN